MKIGVLGSGNVGRTIAGKLYLALWIRLLVALDAPSFDVRIAR